jgi:hypothetical protein
MDTIEIQTLIDITNTNVTRHNQGTQLELNQYRNFTTLRQCAEIRSVIVYDGNPSVEIVDIKGLGFGAKYKGKQTVWTFRFSPDREAVYGENLEHLINDLDQIPVVINLTETINISRAILDLRDSTYKNTVIKAHSGTT